MNKKTVLKYVMLFCLGLVIGMLITPILIGEKVKTVYSDYLNLTCMVYDEENKRTMACNPIDVENNLTYGFELPTNSTFKPSLIIYCTYDLNNKRFVNCYQLNEGVELAGAS